MLRILGFSLAFYVVGLVIVDSAIFGGRYQRIVWHEASFRAYVVGMEAQRLVSKVDTWARSTSFAAPSRADSAR